MVDLLVPDRPLPVSPQRGRTPGWYGMTLLIATEAALFIYLLFSYVLLASQAPGPWPPPGAPDLAVAGANTLVLLASSGAAWWGQKGLDHDARGRLLLGLVGALALGTLFAAVQFSEWRHKPFSPDTDAYGSLYFTITGVHLAHVAVGLIMLACLILWTLQGRFSRTRRIHVTLGVLYWHFVDLVWLAVFATLFLSPRLGAGG